MKLKKAMTAAVIAAVVGCGGLYASAASADASAESVREQTVVCKNLQGKITGTVTHSATKLGSKDFRITMTGRPLQPYRIQWQLILSGGNGISPKILSFGPYTKTTTVTYRGMGPLSAYRILCGADRRYELY